MLKRTPNFAQFTTVKIRVGWARSLDQIMKLNLRSNLGIDLITLHCAAAERGVLIEKEKKRKVKKEKKVYQYTLGLPTYL